LSASTLVIDARSVDGSSKIRFKQWSLKTLLLGSDLVALSAALAVATGLLSGFHGLTRSFEDLRWFVPVMILPLMFLMVGLYPAVGMHPTAELKRLTLASSTGYLLLLCLGHAAKTSPQVLVFSWLITLFLVPVLRSAARSLSGRLGWFGFPAVVFGGGASGRAIIELLNNKKSYGFRPMAVLDAQPREHHWDTPSKLFTGHLSLAADLSRYARHAIVAVSDFPKSEIQKIINEYAYSFDYVLLIPDMVGVSSLWVTAKDLGGVLALEVSQKLMRRDAQTIKRLFDVGISGFALILLLPLFALLAILIKMTSPGPVFYGQRRIGQSGGTFTMWKFRSMRMNGDGILQEHLQNNPEAQAEWERDHKLRNDPRVTAVGKFIRRTSIDELPQLWNVFTGSMSLVGPRPIVQAEVVKYEDTFSQYLRVKPGITGLWQVSGRNDTSYEERVQYDRYYVQNWCVWLDLHILCSTFTAVLFGKGAY
jgi:Undecaprenyl-phosphate galactose phosphotransferase WbaP